MNELFSLSVSPQRGKITAGFKHIALRALCLVLLLVCLTAPAQAKASQSLAASVKDGLVTISGSVGGASGQVVNLMVLDPGGNTDYLNTCCSGAGGRFKVSYAITNTLEGRYTVRAATRDSGSAAETSFLYGPGSLEAAAVLEEGLVKISGTVGEGEGRLISVMITAPDGGLEYAGTVLSGRGGSFALSYALENEQAGKYTVYIGSAGLGSPVVCYLLAGVETKVEANIDKDKLVTIEGSTGVSEKPVSVLVTDPKGETEFLSGVLTEKDGTFRLSYTMESKIKGRYEVTTSVRGLDTPVSSFFIYGTGLESLEISSLTLLPAFDNECYSYTSDADHMISQVRVKPVPLNPEAVITVNGVEVKDGAESDSIALNEGDTEINITVTEPNETVTTYVVAVSRSRPLSADDDLSSLRLSGTNLNEAFNSSVLSYTATVPNSTAYLTVIPLASDESSLVEVNGKALAYGAESEAIALSPGNNSITVKVTAEAGNTKTYTVTVKREYNIDLSGLQLYNGNIPIAMAPVFSPELQSYTADVPNSVTNLTVSFTKQDETSTVTVSGGASLNVGENTITVKVTAHDGSLSKDYTIMVSRAPSDNSLLRDLVLSPGGLGSVFHGNIFSYTVNVASSVSEITITPTVWDDTATVTVNGTAVSSGSASGPVSLGAGINYVYVEVSAQNNSKRLYILTVIRAYSGNADLGGITVNEGTLSPAFDNGVTSYTVNIGNEVTSITAGLITDDISAELTINGVSGYGNSASYTMYDLAIGSNKITVKVVAQNNASKTYEINIIRAESANANLSGLTVRNGSAPIALNPGFAPETAAYDLPAVSSSVSGLKLKPIADSQYAFLTVCCNGADLTPDVSGEYTASLDHGDNTITIIVTAQAGNTKTYTISIRREYNLNLSSLVLRKVPGNGSIDISPSGTDSYTAEVDYAVTAVTVQPAAYSGTAIISVNGEELSSGAVSQPISLHVGENIISITLTAKEDGSSKTYTVKLTRAEEVNVKLSSLTLSDGALSFNQSVYTYTVTVNPHTESITVTPVSADPRSTVTVNGNATSVPVSLGFGEGNFILITVTGWDGKSTQNYSIQVSRPLSNDNTLGDLAVNDVSIAGFDPAVKVYSQNIDYDVSSVTIKPTANDTYSKVWVDSTEITGLNPSVNVSLTAGNSETITIRVQSQSGTVATYTLTLKRAGSSKLSDLELSAGEAILSLDPDFNTNVLDYNVSGSLANEVDTIKVKPVADLSASFTVTCNGGSAISPNQNGEYTVSLSAGSNEISITLTALNTPSRTYTVTVDRMKSSNAYLSELFAGIHRISLNKDVTSYSVDVENLPAAITLRPTVEDSTATVKVDGQTVNSGAESGPINLNVGENIITVEVTAQDGTLKAYTIKIIRAASDNAYLSGLTAEHHGTPLVLNYPFTKEYYTYSLSNLVNSVDSITIRPIREEANSVLAVSCNGGDRISAGNEGEYTIGLAVGINSITVKVTAQNGSVIKTYTLSVTRLPSGNANLSDLSVLMGESSLTLTPSFSSGTETYSVPETVPNSTGSISVIPERAEPNSTVSVSCSGGAVSEDEGIYSVDLSVGINTITVAVTAQNGSDKKTYTVNVTRAGSGNADLRELYAGNQKINLTSETSYSIPPVAHAISSISVRAVLDDNNAVIMSLTCNGDTVAYNSDTDEYTAELKPGDNSISIVVKAQNGTTKTYKVSVKREYDLSLSGLVLINTANDAVINMTASGNNYDAGTINYNISGVTVTPTAAAGDYAAITVGDNSVSNGTASEPISLSVGQNTIEIKVEVDGDSKTYTISINRAAASNNAYLKELRIDEGLWELIPDFDKSSTEYELTVGSATTSIYIEYAADEENASVSVNGGVAGSYMGWAVIDLSEDIDYEIPIVVTAQNGTVKTYRLTVIKASKYSNAQLSGLTINFYNLNDDGEYDISHDFTDLIPRGQPQSHGFDKDYYYYDVSWSGDYVMVSPEAGSEGQRIEVSWLDSAGSEYAATEYISTKTLKTVRIRVTAKDGESFKDYTLDFNASFLADLQVYTIVELGPEISLGSILPLSQDFSPSVMKYVVNISNAGSAEAFIIKALADSQDATVYVAGSSLDSAFSNPYLLEEIGDGDSINITVEIGSASNMITKIYTLTFYRNP